MLGLHLRARAPSSCGKRGPLFIAVCRPLLLRSTGSRHTGPAAVAHGPSRSSACGIPPDQGSNPCPLHWQADSQPLRHQGSPLILFYFLFFVIVLLFFFSFLLLHHMACGILAPRLGVRPELLWWEHQVQTAGLTEKHRPQGRLIAARPPGGPHLGTKTQLYPTACKLQCWMPQTKQPVRQEYSHTRQKNWDDKIICYRRRSKVKTYKTK